MSQLSLLKNLLGTVSENDDVLQFYLDNAGDIICDLRKTDNVESQYLNTQIKIAIELFNKRGAEGQVSHNENGIARSYEKADVSPSLLSQITPSARTPFSTLTEVEVVEDEVVEDEIPVEPEGDV